MSTARKLFLGSLTLFTLGVIASILMAASFMEKGQDSKPPAQPIIEELVPFRGEVFKHFAEFRVQKCFFSLAGILSTEKEPYEQLINVNNIVKVNRFRDGNETEFSSLMFIAEGKHPYGVVPVLVREDYQEIRRRIKKAIETR